MEIKLLENIHIWLKYTVEGKIIINSAETAYKVSMPKV